MALHSLSTDLRCVMCVKELVRTTMRLAAFPIVTHSPAVITRTSIILKHIRGNRLHSVVVVGSALPIEALGPAAGSVGEIDLTITPVRPAVELRQDIHLGIDRPLIST